MRTDKVIIAIAVFGTLAGPIGGIQPLLARDSGHETHGREEHNGEPAAAVHEEHEKHNPGDADGPDAHEDESKHLRLTAEQREHFGISVSRAGPGGLRNEARLPGEIVFNEDRVVHLVPRVAGIARDVRNTVGDPVKAGDVLAVIDSRELANARATYLAAKARAGLVEKAAARERTLWEKQISSEREFLEAQQDLAESRIELRLAEQNLHALGLPNAALQELDGDNREAITRYEITSPIDGVITQKHIASGESLNGDTHIFTIADTDVVWVNLTVYTKDLSAVRKGQAVVLQVDHSGAQARGEVAMVTPFAEEATRTATARIVLDNSDGRWIPGTFVTGTISTALEDLPVVIPRDAVQTLEGREVVFIEDEDGFEAVTVTIGRADREHVEIRSGLEPGTSYVEEGAFELKATVITRDLGSHAGHGH